MKGKKYKWELKFKRTPKATMKTNKMYYNKKADAEHDLKIMKTKYSEMYKNPRIRKI